MASSLDRIEIDRETIGHALIDRMLYVPTHQRSYAWKEEHVIELYQDLAKAITDRESEYFLGSIVVIKRHDAGDFEINDGQQRLATSCILIAAIRDYFIYNNDEKTASLIEQNYLFREHIRTHEKTSKLTLNFEDNDFFLKRILLRPDSAERIAKKKEKIKTLPDSNQKIVKAAEQAAKHVLNIVSTVAQPAKGDQLHTWLDFLKDGARVIWVQVGDKRTAYIIFETMNDRGLKLSAADLLKNHIISVSEERGNEAFDKWRSMASKLEMVDDEADSSVNYIRYSWISKQGPIRSRDLYDSIKEHIRNKTQAMSFISDLDLQANQYAAILSSSHELWAEYGSNAKKHISVISLLGVKQIRPILISAMAKFSKIEIERLLHSIVCWSVRYLLGGITPGALEFAHGKNAQKIADGTITTTEQLLSEMVSVIPDDKQFEDSVSNARVSQARLSRYYLRAMQLCEDGEAEPQYVPSDGDEITLEHILPENPGPEWNFTDAEVKSNFSKLGNQVLLQAKANSMIGNEGYAAKSIELKLSRFSLTREAGSFSEWTQASIIQNQKRLAVLAVKTWPLKPWR